MKNYTPTNARKNFYQILKDINRQNKPVTITPANGNEAAIIISKKDWDSIAETLYLENTGTLANVHKREDDNSGFSNVDDIDWDRL
ncbi:type II toxin-antitoxin system prevent-host-death family antitoxin [Secundilactobacillus kimchicus]|uniref:type II toxin-antitoxin system Phd/YefM family antitoxin n=1 Tax=Secundilactobacillus kimchicus TaxID=528209 RepID=UPI001C00A532|nr:type II toxin-antitoxin system Phd/YefM family antitoxin [Secundilactobacillus kimchicus]MBT9671132.1 type II toxin-antitoxin system prevent-host-death family antitoxin [Secundilactobacillus kimchicus]